MTSYSDAGSPAGMFGAARRQGGGCGASRWKPLEIMAIVAGFAVWWPLGLALVGLKIAQRRGYGPDDVVTSFRNAFSSGAARTSTTAQWRPFSAAQTGNAAFDEWRTAEMAKLDEERRKLDAAQRAFADHLENLRRARDKDEFDAFMRARAAATDTPRDA